MTDLEIKYVIDSLTAKEPRAEHYLDSTIWNKLQFDLVSDQLEHIDAVINVDYCSIVAIDEGSTLNFMKTIGSISF